MKKNIREFFHRGLVSCGFGPVVLAILYLILQHHANLQVLDVNDVCVGIFSISALAFIAGGMNVVYQIERLPLMAAILIHGVVLYISYLGTYLVNDWLKKDITQILIFSLVFALGYIVIWIIIYSVTKRNTKKINKILEQKQGVPEDR